MTESYRKPVQVGVPGDIACRADRTPPEDLPDIQRRCIRDREIAIELARAGNIDQMRKRGHFWDCPAGEARCPTVSFLYPRKPRETREGNGVWKFHYHEGIDLHGTNRVTEILAVMGGNVEHAVLNEGTGFSGYGRIVHIKGDDGRYYLYGHCSQLLVRANQRVEAGQPIARVGRTLFDRDSSPERIQWEKDDADGKPATAATPPQGRAMGPHLHFEVSASSYPKPPAAERTPEGEGAVHREDPAVVLEELGAWGAAYLRPMYFPNGQIVSPESTAALHRRIEQGAAGGYFPIGRGGTWHGGVHLPVPPNTPILSPLSGAIVALRLDETPRANGIFGSSNFILVRHQLESSLTQQLWGAVPGITVPTGRGQIDPKLTGATGDPALVRPVKLMLSRLTPRGVTRPYYVFDDNVSKRRHDLDDGTMNHWLVLAIVEFRDANDLDSQDLHAVLTHGSVAFLRMQDQFRQLLTAERRARRNDVAQRRQRLVAAARGTGRVVDAPSTVYSLFMNLRAVSLDTVLPRCQWLSVASPPLNAAERHQEGIASNAIRAERAEATRETWSAREQVGQLWAERARRPARGSRPAIENPPRLVIWVKQRLKRFRCWSGDEGGVYTPALGLAIQIFFARYDTAYRGHPERAPLWVTRDTYRKLKATPPVQASTAQPTTAQPATPAAASTPTINSRFLRDVRERDSTTGTTKIVVGLETQIMEGSVLFMSGDDGFVHWEMFSHEKLLGEHPSFEDAVDDMVINGDAWELFERVIDTLQQRHGSPEWERAMLVDPDTIQNIYRSGRMAPFRDCQVKFRSEWSFTPSQALGAYQRGGIATTSNSASSLARYMWWQSAASVLPTSPNVWYFNPTYVVAQIAGHAHRFVGTVVVRLSGAATQVHSVRLMDGQREVDEEEVETPISPDGVELGPAPPGSYSVEALNASGRVIQSMPFTIQVGLHGDLPMVIQPASAPPAPPPP